MYQVSYLHRHAVRKTEQHVQGSEGSCRYAHSAAREMEKAQAFVRFAYPQRNLTTLASTTCHHGKEGLCFCITACGHYILIISSS